MRISDWSSDVCSSDLIALVIGQLLRPVTTILTQRQLFRHPVDLLLTLPEIEGPRIFEGLVLLGSLKKRHEGYSRQLGSIRESAVEQVDHHHNGEHPAQNEDTVWTSRHAQVKGIPHVS